MQFFFDRLVWDLNTSKRSQVNCCFADLTLMGGGPSRDCSSRNMMS